MARNRPRSEAHYLDSCRFMPGGVSSPLRSFKGMDMTPLIAQEGRGEKLYDEDGYEYIDFCHSYGALILGHSPKSVTERVSEQLHKGASFGLATALERHLAEKIQKHMPAMEQIRFTLTGTEAVMTAVRLARAYTGKSVIVKFDGHFHGHSDSLLIQAGSGVTLLPSATSQGIPEEFVRLTVSLPFNEIATCRDFLRSRDDIAAVILEPIAGNMGVVPADPQFLAMLREETANKGIVLIFDEVITGFRVGLGGAQGKYGIIPDLTCLGKVIGGGLPVSAFGGKKEIMQMIAPLGSVYHSGTFAGNPLAVAAGLQTLCLLEQPQFFEELEEKTRRFLEPIRVLIAEKQLPIAIQSVGSMFSLFFGVTEVKGREDLQKVDLEKFKSFFRFLFDRGVYISPSTHEAHFISSAHTEQSLKKAQDCILAFCRSM
ncbi:MAG: glutamate-1-semialdehyde 2,1-aminomutase [Chlamydiota bacterium]